MPDVHSRASVAKVHARRSVYGATPGMSDAACTPVGTLVLWPGG